MIHILGANGMLGSMVSQYLLDKNPVLYSNDKLFWSNHSYISFNAEKQENILALEKSLNAGDFVINCIGIIKQKTNINMYKINAAFPLNLSAICAKKSTTLIHISSDCVFSGNSLVKYDVNFKHDSTDVYGLSKSLGEPIISICLRTSIIGPSKNSYGLFEWFRSEQGIINGFTNHIWNGVTTLELAKVINEIINNPIENQTLHVISKNQITKYELLMTINNIFALNKKINPIECSARINRALSPNNSHYVRNDISDQLSELKKWIEKY